MKFLIFFGLCLVASVYSRQIVIREVEDEPETPVVIQHVSQPKPRGNIFADLFNKAGQITSKTVQGVGNIAQGALQGTASFGQGVVNGAQQGLSSALENTGDVAAKFSNGVENEVGNWWNALG